MIDQQTVPVPAVAGSYSYASSRLDTNVDFVVPCAVKEDSFSLVWLPGSGQCPDNELLRRMLNAWHRVVGDQGNLSLVHAVTYKNAEASVAQLVARPERRRLCVGGHSAGAGLAARLSEKFALPLITFGAPLSPIAKGHYQLTVLGENEGGASFVQPKLLSAARSDALPLACTAVTPTAKVLVPIDGDHSLRVRPRDDADKDKYSDTPETRAMNEAVASEMQRFLELYANEGTYEDAE